MADEATRRAIAWLEGDEPEADAAFAAAVAQDPGLAAALVAQARLSTDLRRAFDEVAVEAASPPVSPRRRQRSPRRRQRRRRRSGRLLVAGLLVLAAAATGLFWWLSSPPEQTPVGEWRVGSAVAARLDGLALRGDQPLPAGAALSLAPGGSVTLGSREGHWLQLHGPAQLRVEPSAAADLWLAQGRLVCAIAPDPAGFHIGTPQAIVSVLGTRFRLVVAAGQTSTAVDEGQVRVRAAGGAAALLQADQRLTVAAEGAGPVETVIWQAVAADGQVAPDCQHGGLVIGPRGESLLRAQRPAADADPVQIVGAGTPFRGAAVLQMATDLELRAEIRVDPAVAWYGLWLQDQDDQVHYYAHGGKPVAETWQAIRIPLATAHPNGDPAAPPPAVGDRIRAWRLQFGHPDAAVLVRDLRVVRVAAEP